MKLATLLFVITVLLPPQLALAKEVPFQLNNASFLVESCREAVDIFASQEKTGYLAAYRTSLSEAMRAGYCIGVIEHFTAVNEEYCGHSSGWFHHAQRVASLGLTQHELAQTNTRLLLEEYACDQ